MTINSTYAILARLFGFALAANFFLTNAFAGVTKLSAEPLASSITTDNRPNVMFVLDDSGSMYQDFLPDWAGPISSVSAERFFNAAFNGLAYNPGSQYKPPAMFTAAGALDTTRYPSQTGMDSDGGADSSAKPNWKAVKEDGYGVQSTALGDLTTGAFYYTTVPGEYCDSAQLRNCVASTAPTGSYTFPAKLRWCTTAAKATGTTADSNGYCQAANINTTATGVTNYTYARMPSQRKATLNFSGAGTVSSITVGGVEILSASASGGTSTDLATAIANNIKACTYARVGACATATGYKATSSANVVTIYAPVATNATPVVTGASPTITAFAVGGTPGDVLLTVINPDVTSYAYPGSAAKHIKRTDCAGTTCTYAEEMTNFANWYAYYHTRMQAMKTASSLAFSTVSDRYRVGYYSINPTGSFLNLGIFSDSQKYNWYQKLLSADVDPSAAGTPLRIGLANVGRMYAGKLTTLNGETVNDPVQYSCQRNYTILSTDGYWNDSSLPVKIDGSSAIGQQDGNDLRPYYDGASQTKTVSQTEEIKQQVLKNSFLVESRTQQQQTTSRQLDQSVVTTMTYPWTESYSYLQTRSTPLEKSTYNLISKTYPLTSTTKQLRETIYKITATPRILESYTLDYLKTTIPLQQDEYMIKKTSTVLQKKEYKIKQTSTVLQKKEYKIKQTSTVLQKKEYKIKQTSTVLQKKEYKITIGTKPLNTSTYKIKSTISKQLQMYKETNSTYGDGAWTNTGWVDVSSCTVRASGPNVGANYVRNTQCRYRTLTTPVVTGSLSSCTVVPESSGTAEGTVWSVEKPVACEYETTASVTTGGTCTAAPASATFAAPKVTCTYGTAVNLTGQSSCTVKAESSGPTNYVGPAVTCTEETPVTTNETSCTTRPAPGDFSVTKVECGYTGTATDTLNLTSCSPSTGAAYTSSPYSGPKITCTKNTTPTTTNETSCTTRPDPGASDFSVTKIECGYTGAATDTLNQTSCSPSTGAAYTSSPYSGPKITCTENTTPATSTVTICNTRPAPGDFSVTRIGCRYDPSLATSVVSTPVTCTPVLQSTGNPYSGPAVTCAYGTTYTTATNLTTCTPQPAPGIVNCGYINGTPLTNQDSCTVISEAPVAGTYSGPARTCAYQAAAYSVNPVTSCTTVPQSATFANVQKSCAYDAVGTPATNLLSCTDKAQSATSPYEGPNVVCGYSGTASATNNNATTCNANRQTTSPYTGPAVDCSYNTTPSTTTVATCSDKPQQAGPNYTGGGAVSCAYGTTSAWATATAACTVVPQSAGPNYVTEVQCGYSAPTAPAPVGTCTTVPQSTGPTYTQLTAKDCVPGAFPVVGAPVVTVVDSCSTTPTSSGSPVVVSTATTCTYRAPVTVNTATCTPVPVSTSTPYVTAVTCPVTDTGWVPVAPTCTTAGSASPAVFDATGKIVECKTTDQIGTASSPVPAATCTAGTAGGTLVQTTCVTNEVSRRYWDPALCVPTVGLPSGPDFITTLCPTSVTTTAAASCTEQSPTNPLYQTVTCNSTGGTSNTLADVAAYYYKTDLRTFALGNCTGGLTDTVPAVNGVLCSVTEPMNNVPVLPGAVDANPAQHMTTFTLGLGASGLMQYSPTYASDTSGDYQNVLGVAPYTAANSIAADPSNGVCSWEASGNACNWPFPSSDQQSTIDDLWHAGVNGRGAYFNATDPDSLSASITQALGSLALAGGFTSSAGLGNATFSLKSGDYYAFIPSYTSSVWTGELVRRTVYPDPIELSSTVDWSAQGKLDAKSHTSRTIYANVSGSLGAFNSANFATNANFLRPHLIDATKGLTQYLCSSPDICLSATDQDASHASGAKLVDYLRGDRSNEGVVDDNTKYYRQRAHVLGDIVNSSAVFVRKPRFDYVDPGYARYVAANDKDASGNDRRQAMVYVGSNDGMLHAFAAKGSKATEDLVDAAVKAKADWSQDQANATKFAAIATTAAAASAAMAADTVMGQELWAYVPSMVIPNLYQLADKLYKDKHRYFVDATPNVGDVCASNCTSEDNAVWKTVLVSGLGNGGRGYFALDVTNPTSPALLWEFTDEHLGYSYGNPEFGKLRDGTWVVMFTSGYNNIPNDDGTGGDGKGRLYVLNAITGAQITGSPISTDYGSVASPSGLGKIVAQAISPKYDNTIEAVYGGDLDGNLWRFDVNDDIGASGYDAQLLAVLKDGAGNRQSITIRPEVAEIPSTQEKIVYVGTGRFLHRDDTLPVSDASGQQSLYAIRDPRASATTPSVAIFDNPGGAPRPAGTTAALSRSSTGFIRQVHAQISCPASAPSTICTSGEQVISSTGYPVNYPIDNGWFIDFRQTSERANTDPVLGLGTLVYNTNMPSDSPCSNGSSYQYWLNYLTGGAVINGENTTSMSLVGKTFGDFLVSGASLVQDAKGRLHTITIGQDGRVHDRDVVVGADPSLVRRTSWRELIRE